MASATTVRLEAGGWQTIVSEPLPNLQPCADLLTTSRNWPGNTRYARTPAGIILRAELPVHGGSDVRQADAARLEAWLDGRSPVEAAVPDEDDLETALAESGWPWKRREGQALWCVPAGTGRVRELSIQPASGGLRIEASLVELNAGEEQMRAVVEYLLHAHGVLRFVRVELDAQRQLRLAAWADASALDYELVCGLEALIDACRRVLPQLEALSESPPLAAEYLAMLAESTGTGA
jgi:hypothetical protein